MALKMCLRLDEKFEKFEHNIAFLGMEMAELYKEYAKLKAEFGSQIAVLENEVAKLREENGILASRLMNNIPENLANIQSTVQNNGIATIKQEEENFIEFGISRDPCEEQQNENEQQIIEQKHHYTVNRLDDLNENETSAEDGFGQIEEDGFDEEGDEIMAGNSMEMDGIRERFGSVYGNNLSPHEGPSNIGANEEHEQQHSKKKIKILICQWPGCGYRMNAKYKRDMERHFRKHTGEKPYSCTICGQSFTRHNNMRNHELKQHNLI